MDDLYPPPSRAAVAARLDAYGHRYCVICGYGRRSLGHVWACVIPRLKGRRG